MRTDAHALLKGIGLIKKQKDAQVLHLPGLFVGLSFSTVGGYYDLYDLVRGDTR